MLTLWHVSEGDVGSYNTKGSQSKTRSHMHGWGRRKNASLNSTMNDRVIIMLQMEYVNDSSLSDTIRSRQNSRGENTQHHSVMTRSSVSVAPVTAVGARKKHNSNSHRVTSTLHRDEHRALERTSTSGLGVKIHTHPRRLSLTTSSDF